MPSDTVTTPEDRERIEAERATLARRILEIKDARQLSWQQLGAEAGIAHQTLAAWAVGKYAGNNGRVNDDARKYLDAQDRRQSMALTELPDPGYVATPTCAAIQALLRQAQYLPVMVSAVGAPGIGKTKACEDYAASNPNVWHITALAGHPSGRWLLEELARVMRLVERGGSQRLASVIIDRLRGRQALLIVDEANHLAAPALDLLRGIHDQARCGVALVGNPRVISSLERGRDADFAQLFRRLGGRLNRNRPVKGDVEAILSAWGVTDGEVAKLLRDAAARPGALGVMVMTLRLAHMLASTQGQPVSARHVEAAHQQLTGQEA